MCDVFCPAGTTIDSASNDYWAQKAKGMTIPIDAVPLDAQAYEAQLRAYPDAKHLLSGGWENK
jgi:hypothetical protein